MKKNKDDVSTEDLPQFISTLQSLGVSLDAYLGAYNNNTHPQALEDERKFNATNSESCKKRKLDETNGQ